MSRARQKLNDKGEYYGSTAKGKKKKYVSISLLYDCTTEIKKDVLGLRWFVKIMPKHAMIHSLPKRKQVQL